MIIQNTISRPLFPTLAPLPVQPKEPVKPAGGIRQDPAEPEKGDKGLLDLFRDMLWHPRGIGQSSSLGKRYHTPDEVQNLTPEQMAEEERRKKMADAGVRAGAEGAGVVTGLLPTNQGGAITAAAGAVISDQVDRAVTRGTTAPEEKPAGSAPSTPTPPAADPKEPPTSSTPPAPKPPTGGGLRLNDDYLGDFENFDPETLKRRPTAPPSAPPAPPKADPPKPGRISVGPARATDNANLDRTTDAEGDARLRSGRAMR